MFEKVNVFGLFEMIQKKKVRTATPGLSSASGSGTTKQAVTLTLVEMNMTNNEKG